MVVRLCVSVCGAAVAWGCDSSPLPLTAIPQYKQGQQDNQGAQEEQCGNNNQFQLMLPCYFERKREVSM